MPESVPVLSRRPWSQWVTLAARLLTGTVLLVAGLLKVTELQSSIQSVRLYQLLPWELTAVAGIALPIIEIAVGLALITGLFTRVSAVAGSLMFLAFIIAIASVWARGISIDCGCFGGGGEVDPDQTQYPAEIARDVGLLLAGVWTVWRPQSPFALDSWVFGPDATTPSDAEDKETTK